MDGGVTEERVYRTCDANITDEFDEDENVKKNMIKAINNQGYDHCADMTQVGPSVKFPSFKVCRCSSQNFCNAGLVACKYSRALLTVVMMMTSLVLC